MKSPQAKDFQLSKRTPSKRFRRIKKFLGSAFHNDPQGYTLRQRAIIRNTYSVFQSLTMSKPWVAQRQEATP